MTDDSGEDRQQTPPAAAPVCHADLDRDYPLCVRCGLAWAKDAPAPPCKPLGLGAMSDVLEYEAERHETSHRILVDLRKDGKPADPVPELRRAAQLRAIMRLLDKIRSTPAILDILNPSRKAK